MTNKTSLDPLILKVSMLQDQSKLKESQAPISLTISSRSFSELNKIYSKELMKFTKSSMTQTQIIAFMIAST